MASYGLEVAIVMMRRFAAAVEGVSNNWESTNPVNSPMTKSDMLLTSCSINFVSVRNNGGVRGRRVGNGHDALIQKQRQVAGRWPKMKCGGSACPAGDF